MINCYGALCFCINRLVTIFIACNVVPEKSAQVTRLEGSPLVGGKRSFEGSPDLKTSSLEHVCKEENNFIEALVAGKWKREVGLVIPFQNTAHKKTKLLPLHRTQNERKEKSIFSHVDFSVENMLLADYIKVISLGFIFIGYLRIN